MREDVASHTRTVVSFELDAKRGRLGVCRWKGSHARAVTHFVCPFRAAPSDAPVSGIHKRTALSMEPVARSEPAGEKLTQSTQEVWPLRVCRGVPVSQSQRRAVLSPEPVARREEVEGEKAVQRIASLWPGTGGVGGVRYLVMGWGSLVGLTGGGAAGDGLDAEDGLVWSQFWERMTG